MRKKIISVLLSTAMTVTLLAGCGSSASKTSGTAVPSAASGDKEKVSLTVWGAEEDQSLLQEMTDSFKKQYADKADFDIQIGVQSESTAKDTVLTDVTAAADVYAFADDQINDLVKAGALQEITLDTDSIKSENIASSVDAATVDGKLYAYPMTADNGYFMFYDSEYFTDDDIKTMDGMLHRFLWAQDWIFHLLMMELLMSATGIQRIRNRQALMLQMLYWISQRMILSCLLQMKNLYQGSKTDL